MVAHGRKRRFLRTILMIGISVFSIFVAFRLVGAGSLTPASAPASTMNSTEEAYAALVGTFDSSGVVASRQGDAFQITKCIIQKIAGSPCP